MNELTPFEAVMNGVELLDRKRVPQWRERIDPDKINVCSVHNCILGQLFGSYGKGVTILGLNRETAKIYGFNANPFPLSNPSLFELTDEWKAYFASLELQESLSKVQQEEVLVQ